MSGRERTGMRVRVATVVPAAYLARKLQCVQQVLYSHWWSRCPSPGPSKQHTSPYNPR